MTLATDQNLNGQGLSPAAQAFLDLRDAIMDHWKHEVRLHVDGAAALDAPVLTNTLPAFLDNLAEALSSAHPRCHAGSNTNSALVHGGERARMTSFGPEQVIHEYQILRQSIRVVSKERVELSDAHWVVIDRSLDVATREAVRAFTLIQDEFRRKVAAALSHDMRTPLAVIANGAQLIRISPDPHVVQRTALMIESNAARLEDMMGELLDALTHEGDARLPLQITRFDALELLKETRDQYCAGRHVTDRTVFELAGDSVHGYWCRTSLQRAIENLINNAVKYGDGNVVRISAQSDRGRLMLAVHNDGNPIAVERHARIFDYLSREGARPDTLGWGIGLQFVKAVAESHGGSVVVDSSAQTGTTFLIDIPTDSRPYVAGAASHDASA